MKYGELTMGQIEAMVNKLGGMEGVQRLLSGELVIQAVRRLLAISRAGNSVYTGTGLATWLGRKNGDGLSGDPQRDPRSLALTELDIEKIQFKHYIDQGEGETMITGENRWKAIKASGDIGLDAQVGWDLYKEPGQKALRWLYDNRKVTWMEFPEVLRYSNGRRYFLYLYRDDDGSWSWYYYCLGNGRNVFLPCRCAEQQVALGTRVLRSYRSFDLSPSFAFFL
ncbi:MAG: hypothetical protein AAB965_00635, partial [Patescibacteria group bacterium]